MNSPRRGVPLYFYPLIILSFAGSGIYMVAIYRVFSSFFGIHSTSSLSILAVIILCLLTGSLFWGKMADKSDNQMVVFLVIEAITGLFALLHTPGFSIVTGLFNEINQKYQPGAFGVEMLQVVLSFVFMILPVGVIGGKMPVLSRYFIKHAGQAGNRMSTIMATGAGGGMTGILLSGFFLTPVFGLRVTLYIAAAISLLLFILILVFVLTGKAKAHSVYTSVMAHRVRRTAMMFRKNRTVLETGAKLTRAMLRVHVFQGFLVSSLLILSFRLLTQFALLRHSYLQVILLAVTLAGIGLGSALYRRIADRTANTYLVLATMEIITGFALLLSLSFTIFITPVWFDKSGSTATWNYRLCYQFVISAALLFLPFGLIGAMLPFAGKVYPRRLQKSGTQLGRLGSLFFFGMLSGLLMTPFLFIPMVGVHNTFLLLILLTLLSGIYLLLRDSRLKRGFRLGFAIVAIAVFIALKVLLNGTIGASIVLQRDKSAVIHEGSGSTVVVHSASDGTQSLTVNGIAGAETGINGIYAQRLPVYLACLFKADIQTSLFAGFGTGIPASTLINVRKTSIRIAEPYSEVMNLSSDVFADLNDDIITNSRVEMSFEDPVMYLHRNSVQYDLILSGIISLQNAPGLFEIDYYSKCYERLQEDGLLCQILPFTGITLDEFTTLFNTCAKVFPSVSLWYLTPDYGLVLARKHEKPVSFCQLTENYHQLIGQARNTVLEIPDLMSLLGRRLSTDGIMKTEGSGVNENSIDHPVIEFSKTFPLYRDPSLFMLLKNSDVALSDYWLYSDCPPDAQAIQRIRKFSNAMKSELTRLDQP